MHSDLLPQVALSLLPGLGPVTIRQLISYCGSAGNVFRSSKAELALIPGIGPKTAEIIKSASNQEEAEEQIDKAREFGAVISCYTDQQYPSRLKSHDNAPVLLYSVGKPAYDRSYTVGVVGTRRPTPYGTGVVRKILTDLFPFKPTVISGLAYGIDIAAHKQALELGLPTIGVLGSSLDHIYPPAHQGIARKMLNQGGLVTELGFGSKPEAFHFPSRNRIIAALSDALVVVEARNKGGALITASYTRDFGKTCFAVPGPIDTPASFGCNQLIKQHQASMLTSGKDLVEQLKWKVPRQQSEISYQSGEQVRILEVLRRNPLGVHVDQICRKTQIPINRIARELLDLEVRGEIKAAPGKKFVLNRK